MLSRAVHFAYLASDSNTLPMLQRIAHLILKLSGWTPMGEVPTANKVIFIAAPHTTNWDGFWLMVYKVAVRIDLHFLAKHTLFWWPLGTVLRALGAIPIDRSDSTSTVQQVVNEFARRDHFWFALAPEGTRKWQPYWKTGFYRIAKAADIPLVLGFIDYEKKQMGIGITLPAERILADDLRIMQQFYESRTGRIPGNTGPIEFPPDYCSSDGSN